MTEGINYRRFVEVCVVSVICLATSFLNYCLIQIVVYFFPLTIVPLAISRFYGYELPVFFTMLFGILDDALYNCPLGLCGMIYALILLAMPYKRQ
jgi:hypothetical protein